MPEWLSQGFFIAMMFGLPALLLILFVVGYMKHKKEGEMWEDLDDETLEEMSSEAEESPVDTDDEDEEK